MQVINYISELKSIVGEYRKQNKTIGFVPTMGALHEGHLSLVSFSKENTDITVVSIFVNPTQFNDKNDLKNYPRTLDADLEKLASKAVDIVFAPSESEMYPEPDTRIFDFGNLDKVMEGAHRPGHFNGVAQVVSKLFSAVEPDKAFFGDKDFQQVAVIKQMVRQLNLPVAIVPCPIVREADGLAMSSRNTLLSPVQRQHAVLISKTLFESREMAKTMDVKELKAWVVANINKDPELEVEYFEIVDDTDLISAKSWSEPNKKVGCITVKVGNVRLIDNIRYNS
ncbi:MAG: pantoate--beta-alanine ligase [Bacteroidota bacterium]|nr:pantoate--beta-alanine ligase [Bacteroidota bacterium]